MRANEAWMVARSYPTRVISQRPDADRLGAMFHEVSVRHPMVGHTMKAVSDLGRHRSRTHSCISNASAVSRPDTPKNRVILG